MARKHVTPLPSAAAPQPPHPPADGPTPERVRLANRTALLTFLAAFAVVLGLVLLPRAWAGDGPIPLRLAAAVPVLAAAWLIHRVRGLRTELRLLGREGAPSPGASAQERPSRPSDRRAPAPTTR